jgi:hypothetical protein
LNPAPTTGELPTPSKTRASRPTPTHQPTLVCVDFRSETHAHRRRFERSGLKKNSSCNGKEREKPETGRIPCRRHIQTHQPTPVCVDVQPETHWLGFERSGRISPKESTVQRKKSEKETRDRSDSMSPSLSEGRQSSGGRGRCWMIGRSDV